MYGLFFLCSMLSVALGQRIPAERTIILPRPTVDCRLVICEPLTCLNPRPPPIGGCCQTCPEPVDCSRVSCLRPVCRRGEELFTPPRVCCPRCRPIVDQCNKKKCRRLRCKKNEMRVTPKGKCCPVCRKDKRRSCRRNGRIYKDGQSFEVDCNTCTCRNGRISCTEKACLDCSLVRCAFPICKPGEKPVTPKGQCCPVCTKSDQFCFNNGKKIPNGQSFKVDCNTCQCVEGQVLCTLIACEPRKTCRRNGKIYKDGESFKIDCNTCSCRDGNIACTKIFCGNKKVCRRNGKTYKDGESFKIDCNTCTCRNGNIACTKIACPPPSCSDVFCPAVFCPPNRRHYPGGACCPVCRDIRY